MVKLSKYEVGDNIRHDETIDGKHQSYVGIVESISPSGEAIIKVKQYAVNGVVQKNKPVRKIVQLHG